MYICIYLKEKAFTKDDILCHKKLFSHDSTYLHSHFKQLSLSLAAISLMIYRHKHKNTQKR